MISLTNGAGSQRWLPLGSLPPKMASLSTLKTCPWVWTLPRGSLSECCDQRLLLFILSLLPLWSFSFLSPYYNKWMWLYGPIGLDLCSLQPPVFEAFYRYLGLTALEYLSFRTVSSCDSGTMLLCFCKVIKGFYLGSP
jgi:hypothetical protein